MPGVTCRPHGLITGQVRAAAGAVSNRRLADLMTVQRSRFAPAMRPLVPVATPVDPARIFAEWWMQRKKKTRPWQCARRQLIKAELQLQAGARAAEMFAQTRAAQAAEQQRADGWWAALMAGYPGVVTAALGAAFADNPAPVRIMSAGGGHAVLVVSLPDIGVLPERKPHVTPGGRLSSKPWTKTELNDVYAELLGAHLLATIRETWAVAPSVTEVRLAAWSMCPASGMSCSMSAAGGTTATGRTTVSAAPSSASAPADCGASVAPAKCAHGRHRACPKS